MPYLIDGHNLIARIPGMSLRDDDDEQQLIGLLQGFTTRTRQSVEVFFDKAAPGHAGWRTTGRVVAHFIAAQSSADQAIRERLGQLGTKARGYQVVSSDQAVQRSARAHGAGVLSADEFRRLLFPPGKPAPEKPELGPLSDQEIERWAKLFGDEDEED